MSNENEGKTNEVIANPYNRKKYWHTEDVMQNYDCESEVAMEILELAMNNQWVIENIFTIVDQYAEDDFKLKNRNQ